MRHLGWLKKEGIGELEMVQRLIYGKRAGCLNRMVIKYENAKMFYQKKLRSQCSWRRMNMDGRLG